MPPEQATIPHPPLTSEQRARRERNRIRARERQLLYPRDPDNPRKHVQRLSPRANIPTITDRAARSCRVVCEHPTKAPNEFLYLFQYTDEPVSTYAFHTPNGDLWRKPFPSIFQACVSAAQAGYLDASW